MKDKESELKQQRKEDCFDWRAFLELLYKTPRELEKIGRAWPLFFDICFNLNRGGMYSGTYPALGKRYGVAPTTVRKWRRYLCRHSLIESFTRGHLIVFRLNEPYVSFLKPVFTEGRVQTKDSLLQAILNAIKDQENLKVD